MAMRITFVLPAVTLHGGVRVVAIYAERLKRRGHEVVVVAPPLEMPVRRKIKSFVLGRGWPKSRFDCTYFAGLDLKPHILERVGPVADTDVPVADIVVATGWSTAAWVQRLSHAKGAKAILIQGYEVEDGKPNPRLDATWRMPMHKILVSRWLVDLARQRFGDSITSYVPNSVDLQQFHAPPRGKQVVPTIGLLYSKSWFKGCRTSLSALKLVVSALPDLRLLSFGAEHPGPAELRLPSYAEFQFRPDQDRLRDIYAQCDVWLCGSNREGFSLPVLEAMACRCPVVATRVGGPLDTIKEGANGYLVEVGDSAAMADRLLRVLGLAPDLWRQMSNEAYRTVSGFTWDDATDLLEKAFRLAIERDRRGDWKQSQPTGA